MSWRNVAPAAAPSARFSHAIVYDGNAKEILLYAGWNRTTLLEDFWSYSGTIWFRRAVAAR